MKKALSNKIFWLAAAALLIISSLCFADYLDKGYLSFYWIIGQVEDAGDVKADGRQVILYQDLDKYNTEYASTVIAGNNFSLDAFLFPGSLAMNGTFYAAIPNDNPDDPNAGYGADPVELTITDAGYVDLGLALKLALGAGPLAPSGELAPNIKLWFGNRLYQPLVYGEDRPFVIAPNPEIKANISIQEPYAVSGQIEDYSIIVDPGTTKAKTLSLSSANMVAQAMAAGDLKSFSLEYAMSESEKLEEGEHVFEVTARSAGTQGTPASTTYLATVEVVGGPLRMIGQPVVYPSPYSIPKDKIVTVQYILSADANIDMYLVDVGGKRVKHWVLNAGAEGGAAGLNKVTWDGMTDQGYLAGNGIYVGTIIGKDENKLLGKFKLTIVN